MKRLTIEYAPDEVSCAYCGKVKKAAKHIKYKYRKGQRTFYCDDKCRSLASETTCIVNGCEDPAEGKKYCSRHRKQMYRHGKILKRTRFDPNEFIKDGDTCKIYLYDKEGKKQAEVAIDIEDMEKCKNIKWSLGGTGYAWSDSKLYLHNFVLNRKTNMTELTDHKDHDKLNNRKNNLRPCNKSQNAANIIKKNMNSSSIFKGVYWEKSRKRWIARITKNYKGICLGSFKKETDAALAYNKGAKRIFGEFANINII